MNKINLTVGDTVKMTKTISETDLSAFGRITGSAVSGSASRFLLASLTNSLAWLTARNMRQAVLGIGIDEARFFHSVKAGDTICGTYKAVICDEQRMRVYGECTFHNQDGVKVFSGMSIMKVLGQAGD